VFILRKGEILFMGSSLNVTSMPERTITLISKYAKLYTALLIIIASTATEARNIYFCNGEYSDVPCTYNDAIRSQQQQAKVEYKGERLSINFQAMPLSSFYNMLGDFTGLKFILEPGNDRSITVRVQGEPWDKVFIETTTNLGLEYTMDAKENTVNIYRPQ